MAGAIEIAVRARSIGQLFNSLDPAPFREKDLDDGVEEFIVGWVANWRPIEIYLYDWLPIRRRIRLFERIAAARVEVKAG